MRFFVRRNQERPPGAVPPFAVLRTDNWDDYTFKTMFHPILYLSDTEQLELGPVRILQLGQERGATPIDEMFEQLDESYCSLGGQLEYYQSLRTVPEGVLNAYLKGLRDAANDPEVLAQFQSEPGFRTSLLRDSSSDFPREAAALLHAHDGSTEEEEPLSPTQDSVDRMSGEASAEGTPTAGMGGLIRALRHIEAAREEAELIRRTSEIDPLAEALLDSLLIQVDALGEQIEAWLGGDEVTDRDAARASARLQMLDEAAKRLLMIPSAVRLGELLGKVAAEVYRHADLAGHLLHLLR